MALEYKQMFRKWFSLAAPVNAVKASTTIGSGTDGTVTTAADLVGTEGNDFTIQVVAGVGNNISMSAVLTGKDILVTLGTDGAGALDATKNTAILVASAINALDGVNAGHSGTGATAIGGAVAKKNLTNGRYATPVATACFIIIDGVWYISDGAVSKWDTTGWKSATPS